MLTWHLINTDVGGSHRWREDNGRVWKCHNAMFPPSESLALHMPPCLQSNPGFYPEQRILDPRHSRPDVGSTGQTVSISEVTGQPAHRTADGGWLCSFQSRGLHGYEVLLLDPVWSGLDDVFRQGHHVHLQPEGQGWRRGDNPCVPTRHTQIAHC